MNWEAILGITALIATFFTIIASVYYFGQLTQRLINVEARLLEDREKNTDQHKDFYETKNSVTSMNSEFNQINHRMENVETYLKEILLRITKE